MPRPSDPGSHSRGLGKQTPPSEQKGCARAAKKDRDTTDRPLALCRGSGALPATKPRPSDSNLHSRAWQTTPPSEQKGCARATQKRQGNSWSPSCSDQRLGGSSCNQTDSFHAKELGTEPATVQGFEGWAPKGLDSCSRTIESGTTMGEPVHGQDPSKRNAWDALSRVRNRQGGL